MTRVLVRRVTGHIDFLDVAVGRGPLERIKAALAKVGVHPKPCLFFEDVQLENDVTLSERLELDSAGDDLARDGSESSGSSEDEDLGPAPVSDVEEPSAALGGATIKKPAPAWVHRLAERPVWRIVGGAQTLGVAVRHGESLKSDLLSGRLRFGSHVEEVDLRGHRLQYRLLSGTGPVEGWISTQISDKELATRSVGYLPRSIDARFLPVVLMFPGEGCQQSPMLSHSVSRIPAVQMMFRQAERVLGYDLHEVCEEFPEMLLARTKFGQPAVFAASLAALYMLMARKPNVVARAGALVGFGMGYYTALCAAGVLAFEDALKVLQVRAEAMEETIRASGPFLMMGVQGLDADKVQQLCHEVSATTGSQEDPCFICHRTGERQFGVCGPQKSIVLLHEMVLRAGATSQFFNTNAPSESRLVGPALQKLEAVLAEVAPRMKPPACTVWTTTGPRPLHTDCEVSEIVADLLVHLTAPVMWGKTVMGLTGAGFKEFYDVGSRGMLKRMMTGIAVPLVSRTHVVDARGQGSGRRREKSGAGRGASLSIGSDEFQM